MLFAEGIQGSVRQRYIETAELTTCSSRFTTSVRLLIRVNLAVLISIGALAIAANRPAQAAQISEPHSSPIKFRNIDVARTSAAAQPRNEGDQALHNDWPLYRSERGQIAFNDAMATLNATNNYAPPTGAFSGCERLDCPLTLPSFDDAGWLPSGRLWVSPSEYILFVRSPRNVDGKSYRRRDGRNMRYFVFHEFRNSTRNTDVYDTISSHSGSVFVPLYMSKEGTDANGRRFVAIVQVAPYDVVSTHASNLGNKGSGIEVAKNHSDELQSLQGLAGILVTTILKKAAPQLRVVNHRDTEGRPMLERYEAWLAKVRERDGSSGIALPFVPAPLDRLAAVTGGLSDLIKRPEVSKPVPVAQRLFVFNEDAMRTSGRPTTLAANSVGLTVKSPLRIDDRLLSTLRSGRLSWLDRASDLQNAPKLVEPIRLVRRPERVEKDISRPFEPGQIFRTKTAAAR